MFIYSVILAHQLIKELCYSHHEELSPGTIVLVTIKKKKVWGIINKLHNQVDFPVKPMELVHELTLSPLFLEFLNKAGKYNFISINNMIKLSLPELSIKKYKTISGNFTQLSSISLTMEQEEIKNAISLDSYQISVIFGVTGSGKTELSISLMEKILREGGQILILVPEIGLIGQWEEKIKKYLIHGEIVIWHCTSLKRSSNFHKISTGQCQIIIGARSSIFLSYKNLKLIIVDEEHDSSYKQETFPPYHGRDMAILRGKIFNIPVILLSATPSVETYHNVRNNNFKIYKLTQRFNSFPTPQLKIIRKNPGEILTSKLSLEIKENLIKKEQSIIYINRRGYSQYAFCDRCQIIISCNNCSFFLVPHKILGKLVCHYCGGKYFMECKGCGKQDFLISHGLGVEKVADSIQKSFPSAKVMIFSSDYFSSAKKIAEAMEKIKNSQVDIIVGTQIISKGYDIKNVTLVGIIDADFDALDFRSKEIIYQSLVQIAGRAGRHLPGSRVIVQTAGKFSQEYYHDYEKFLNDELEQRRIWQLPPFKKIIKFQFQGKKEETVKDNAMNFCSLLMGKNLNPETPFSGKKISNVYSWKLYLKKNKSFSDHEDRLILEAANSFNNGIFIEVDPLSL